MVKTVELKIFFELDACKEFINAFSKNNVVIRNEVTPILKNSGTMKYFVFIEFES
ncbi:MAG: hypothetical protein KKF52_04460 [Nanoarchaeota archaeon]|nr:hypothetical protein [Nanoarchaeota archaeon]MBU4242457.1 hypothetical protein [Nanoarchaeota archaeon]MBU4352430.1 hypothetical protein [Nanoarchaeota archaeon]